MKKYLLLMLLMKLCAFSYAQKSFNIGVFGSRVYNQPDHSLTRSNWVGYNHGRSGSITTGIGAEIQFFFKPSVGLSTGFNYNKRGNLYLFSRFDSTGVIADKNVNYYSEYLTVPLQFVWKPLTDGNVSFVTYTGLELDINLSESIKSPRAVNPDDVIERSGVYGYNDEKRFGGGAVLGAGIRISTLNAGAFELTASVHRSLTVVDKLIISGRNSRDNSIYSPAFQMHYSTIRLKWFFLNKPKV